ncbi:urea transporter [Actinomadura bangladeshensis]|uniref:Urea transporter n=1 Tax=Actinomadura bangladeshensis TaxID=453573 RepID=A0A6L9QDV8_9ACTN|nr:urea transporter [Actinomadura bangladeshensis]NEA23651.1 urea transporter [Actinomadura bangladeshensis]
MASSPSTDARDGERVPADRAKDAVLTIPRGVAQVDFQPSVWTGLIFIVALFVGGWQFGAFALLGVVTATVTAYLMGADRNRVLMGLEGFNGTLIGVALVLYLSPTWSTAALVVGGAVAGSVLTAAMSAVLTPYNLPTFTAPFCVVALVMVIGAPSYHRLWEDYANTLPPSATDPGTTMTWSYFWHGFFNGIGQVFFQDVWYVGLIFLIGLAVSSRLVAAAAAVSSLIGLFTGWWMGAQAADIGAGLYGYNAVLTGIALTGTFLALTPAGVVYAAIGAATAAGLTAGLTNLFSVVGGHTLTWPFVLVAWVFLAAVPVFTRIRRAA